MYLITLSYLIYFPQPLKPMRIQNKRRARSQIGRGPSKRYMRSLSIGSARKALPTHCLTSSGLYNRKSPQTR